MCRPTPAQIFQYIPQHILQYILQDKYVKLVLTDVLL